MTGAGSPTAAGHMARRWRIDRPDGAYTNYGGKDLLSFAEIADKLGLGESNVRNYSASGLMKLRMALRIEEMLDDGDFSTVEDIADRLVAEGFKMKYKAMIRYIYK